MTIRVFIICALTCNAVLAEPPMQPSHYLDLLTLKPTTEGASSTRLQKEDLRKWRRPPPPADSGPIPRFPFQATLLSIDRTDYALGDRIIFTLQLTNVSGEPFAFPWSVEPGLVRPDMAGARILVLSLVLTHPTLGRQNIGFHRVFGADEIPGSLRIIGAGETLEVRGETPVQLRTWWPRGEEPWKNVKVKANLVLASRAWYYPGGTSDNEFVVQLRRR